MSQLTEDDFIKLLIGCGEEMTKANETTWRTVWQHRHDMDAFLGNSIPVSKTVLALSLPKEEDTFVVKAKRNLNEYVMQNIGKLSPETITAIINLRK